jgi:hypothetical protein
MMSKRGFLHFATILLIFLIASPSTGEDSSRGLPPSDQATYIPKLGGLLNKTMHNHYGQKKDLAECVVLRGSSVKEGKVHVPAGGLFYASSTSEDARPLMRDPFLILGEEAYLLSLRPSSATKTDVRVKKGGKRLIDPSGYRIWYEYATDHYGKPYGEFALLPPSGGWQIELPVSTSFPEPVKLNALKVKEGMNPQQKEFFLSSIALYGLTRFQAKKVTHEEAHFSKIEYPTIPEAVFSLDRPYVVQVRQESYRWWRNKRIYAFRKENGILVEAQLTGGNIGVKLLVNPSNINWKIGRWVDRADLDIHIELVVDPSWYKGLIMLPGPTMFHTDGRKNDSFMIYHDLVKLKDGDPWPRDSRYLVRLEPRGCQNAEAGGP